MAEGLGGRVWVGEGGCVTNVSKLSSLSALLTPKIPLFVYIYIGPAYKASPTYFVSEVGMVFTQRICLLGGCRTPATDR